VITKLLAFKFLFYIRQPILDCEWDLLGLKVVNHFYIVPYFNHLLRLFFWVCNDCNRKIGQTHGGQHWVSVIRIYIYICLNEQKQIGGRIKNKYGTGTHANSVIILAASMHLSPFSGSEWVESKTSYPRIIIISKAFTFLCQKNWRNAATFEKNAI